MVKEACYLLGNIFWVIVWEAITLLVMDITWQTTTTMPFVLSIWGRLHEPKENYVGSDTWISFLYSFLSSNMPSLRPLASISCRITSIYIFFGLPCALLTCPNLIRFTRRTSASVGLRRTWPNHRRQFSYLLFYRGYAYLSTNILISHLITPRVTTHPTKHVYHCYTHLLRWCLFIAQHSVSYNKAGLIAIW